MQKVKAAILGAGDMGLDILSKVAKGNRNLDIAVVADPSDNGALKPFEKFGCKLVVGGPEAALDDASITMVFDCTAPSVRGPQWEAARSRDGRVVIDLGADENGVSVVPSVNLAQAVSGAEEFNLSTYAVQAGAPIVAAVNGVTPVRYAEVVVTTPSRTAGCEARACLDEIIKNTGSALESIGGAEKGKAILLLNPADPPFAMRATIYCCVADAARVDDICVAVENAVESVRAYMPGYSLRFTPEMDGDRLVVMVEVAGDGNCLPAYAGNVEIMTDAALAVAAAAAETMLQNGKE